MKTKVSFYLRGKLLATDWINTIPRVGERVILEDVTPLLVLEVVYNYVNGQETVKIVVNT